MWPDSTDLVGRRTLRHWPWLALCIVGALIFGLLAFAAGNALRNASSIAGYMLAGAVTLGLSALVVYTLASLRTRTVLDRSGATSMGAFSRKHVPWPHVDRLDVTHSLPGWAVRAWLLDGQVSVVYLCHDTHGKRPTGARTFDEPPTDAPVSIHRGFTEIGRFWQSSRSLQ